MIKTITRKNRCEFYVDSTLIKNHFLFTVWFEIKKLDSLRVIVGDSKFDGSKPFRAATRNESSKELIKKILGVETDVIYYKI